MSLKAKRTSQKLVLLSQDDKPQVRTGAGSTIELSPTMAEPIRVSAYATSSNYDLKFLYFYVSRQPGLMLRQFDDCIYARQSLNDNDPSTNKIFGAAEGPAFRETFYYSYGVVVMWNYESADAELDMISSLPQMPSSEMYSQEDFEVEEFTCIYDINKRPKIFNDIIVLGREEDYLVKYAISCAIAQSVKLSYFEVIIERSLDRTGMLPKTLAKYGSIQMNKEDCIKEIGSLFDLRSNILLGSAVLDTPEYFWTDPSNVLMYETTRAYLEISQRVKIINQKIGVVADLLEMLNELLSKSYGESLEWVVIVMLCISVLIATALIFARVQKALLIEADALS